MAHGVYTAYSICVYRTHVFPAKRRFAAFTVNVGDSMQTCQQNPLFRLPATNVYAVNKQHINGKNMCCILNLVREWM